jgi:hypothetical protein
MMYNNNNEKTDAQNNNKRWNHRLYSGDSKTLVKIFYAFDLRRLQIMIILYFNTLIFPKVQGDKIQYEK